MVGRIIIMDNQEIIMERTKLMGQLKLDYENIRHEHIMEELEFMAKHKIKVSPRGVFINVKNPSPENN